MLHIETQGRVIWRGAGTSGPRADQEERTWGPTVCQAVSWKCPLAPLPSDYPTSSPPPCSWRALPNAQMWPCGLRPSGPCGSPSGSWASRREGSRWGRPALRARALCEPAGPCGHPRPDRVTAAQVAASLSLVPPGCPPARRPPACHPHGRNAKEQGPSCLLLFPLFLKISWNLPLICPQFSPA